MKLSFIIVNYKTPHLLRLCLKRLYHLGLSFDFEVIVIDNASNDESVSIVEQQFPSVTLIANATNVGHQHGNNQGLEIATGEYSLLINPDILFSNKNDIERILQYLDEHPKTALLGPQLHN